MDELINAADAAWWGYTREMAHGTSSREQLRAADQLAGATRALVNGLTAADGRRRVVESL